MNEYNIIDNVRCLGLGQVLLGQVPSQRCDLPCMSSLNCQYDITDVLAIGEERRYRRRGR